VIARVSSTEACRKLGRSNAVDPRSVEAQLIRHQRRRLGKLRRFLFTDLTLDELWDMQDQPRRLVRI
jgi:hypothetical protein